jgi:hypothetical protein
MTLLRNRQIEYHRCRCPVFSTLESGSWFPAPLCQRHADHNRTAHAAFFLAFLHIHLLFNHVSSCSSIEYRLITLKREHRCTRTETCNVAGGNEAWSGADALAWQAKVHVVSGQSSFPTAMSHSASSFLVCDVITDLLGENGIRILVECSCNCVKGNETWSGARPLRRSSLRATHHSSRQSHIHLGCSTGAVPLRRGEWSLVRNYSFLPEE